MITIVGGDILNASEDIICHQVNCKGVMGSGLAKKIREKYPKVYEDYHILCEERNEIANSASLLGICQLVVIGEDKFVANLFGQNNYGRGIQHTDYNSLTRCFDNLLFFVRRGYSLAIPYGIGCGLGGGDWNVVYKIIENTFKDYNVTIYKLDT